MVQATEAGAQSLAADPDLHAAIIELANATDNILQDQMTREKELAEMVQQLCSLALQQEMSSNDSGPQQVKVRSWKNEDEEKEESRSLINALAL
jgi:hypothetical protein